MMLLFMGRSRHEKVHFQRRYSLSLLTRKMEVLENRLQRLEARLSVIDPTFLMKSREQGLRRRGRTPRLSRMELFGIRERLVHYCSFNWPELVWILNYAQDASDAARLIQRHLEPGIWNEHEHLYQNADQLWSFVKSKRYHGDPRQVADAMAGVPKLSWRTSWNRCMSDPTHVSLHQRAYRDYLRRKFPERFHELLRAETTDEVITILDRARTDDVVIRLLRAYPERVLTILEEGKPRGT